jgi:hypothetical protein
LPTGEQLKAYEGKYQLIDELDNFIQIMAKDNHLLVKQLWDSKDIIFDPKTATFFDNREQSLPLLILKNDGGAVVQVKLHGNDLFNKVKKGREHTPEDAQYIRSLSLLSDLGNLHDAAHEVCLHTPFFFHFLHNL